MVPSFLRERKHRSLLVIGLDNAGKTSILCHLANVTAANKNVATRFGTMPTIGVQLVEFRRRNIRWAAWDMSGQGRYRGLWASHAHHVHGVIFVVDVSDRSRIAVARDELRFLFGHHAFRRSKTPLAIMANKHDMATTKSTKPGATTSSRANNGCLTLDNICIGLGVDTIQVQRPTRVFSTSAMSGEGIEDAMTWLTKQAKGR